MIGEAGSKNVDIPVVGTAKQIGTLIGLANASFQQQYLAFGKDEYSDYMCGLIRGLSIGQDTETQATMYEEDKK